MRADQDVHLARLDGGDDFLLLLRRTKAREQIDRHREGGKARAEGLIMLISKHGRRRQQS